MRKCILKMSRNDAMQNVIFPLYFTDLFVCHFLSFAQHEGSQWPLLKSYHDLPIALYQGHYPYVQAEPSTLNRVTNVPLTYFKVG